MPTKTYLTYDDVQRMLECTNSLRDRLILMFYYDTGCRCSELIRVKLKDIGFDNGTVLIPHLKRGIKKKCPVCGKAGGRRIQFCSHCGADLSGVEALGIEERSRIIDVSSELVGMLSEYVKGENLNSEDKLFNLTRQAIYHIVRQSAKIAGLDGKIILNPETGKRHYVHPHNFRDSLAVDWLNVAGNDMGKQKALQEQLGHKNFETTQRYNKLTPAAVKKVRDEVRNLRSKLNDDKGG